LVKLRSADASLRGTSVVVQNNLIVLQHPFNYDGVGGRTTAVVSVPPLIAELPSVEAAKASVLHNRIPRQQGGRVRREHRSAPEALHAEKYGEKRGNEKQPPCREANRHAPIIAAREGMQVGR
jgi:hypothetical protein